MPRRYLVLVNGRPARFCQGMLWGRTATQSYDDQRRVSTAATVFPSIRAARHAIEAARGNLGRFVKPDYLDHVSVIPVEVLGVE